MRTFAATVALMSLSLPAGALAELRTYSVDPQYRQEVYQALAGVLSDRPQPIGRVERLPTGQFLVDTSPELHAQIETILDDIAAQQPAAAARVALRYWVVLGSRNAGDDAGLPVVLRETLDELEAIHGDLGFRVVGNASLVTESGQPGELEGNPLSIEQEAYAQGNILNADLEIQFLYTFMTGQTNTNQQGNPFETVQRWVQRVELRTTLEAGDVVVLSENSIDGVDLDGTLFYIVHWPGEQ